MRQWLVLGVCLAQQPCAAGWMQLKLGYINGATPPINGNPTSTTIPSIPGSPPTAIKGPEHAPLVSSSVLEFSDMIENQSPADPPVKWEVQSGQDHDRCRDIIAAYKFGTGTVLDLALINRPQMRERDIRETVMRAMQNPKRHTPHQFSCMAAACAVHCDMELVQLVLDTARRVGVRVTVRFMTKVVNAAAKNKRWVLVSQLLRHMRDRGTPPNEVTYTAILSAMAKAGQHAIIADLVAAEGLEMDLVMYNSIISGCAAGGINTPSYRQAKGYYAQMKERNIRPDVLTFSSLINAAKDGTASSVKRAYQLLDEMQGWGIFPDHYCANTLMSICTEAGLLGKTLELFHEMDSWGVKPDVVSYNTALAAHEKLKDSEGALLLLRRMQSDPRVRPDLISFNCAISALSWDKRWQDAVGLFKEMQELGLRPSVVTWNALITACARGEKPELALQYFQQLKERGPPLNERSYGAALHACLAGGNWQLAAQLIPEMDRKKLPSNVVTYTTAIHACVKAGQPDAMDAAMELYQRARTLGPEVQPNRVTYRKLLEGCALTHRWRDARALLDSMIERGLWPDTFMIDCAVQSCHDQAAEALRFVRVASAQQIRLEVRTYNALLEVLHRAGAAHLDTAFMVLDTMEKQGLVPDPDSYRHVLKLCRAAKAFDRVSLILNHVSKRAIAKRNFDEALALLEKDVIGPRNSAAVRSPTPARIPALPSAAAAPGAADAVGGEPRPVARAASRAPPVDRPATSYGDVGSDAVPPVVNPPSLVPVAAGEVGGSSGHQTDSAPLENETFWEQ